MTIPIANCESEIVIKAANKPANVPPIFLPIFSPISWAWNAEFIAERERLRQAEGSVLGLRFEI
jgi:hypothetical protein